ncbi:MAG: branched-chain amino acid aminotransferase [Defluviitaleaceae bacterium]|nr:branched-chain amino acid aminotransferase [Defluviitaleaceae bacterium]
MQISITKTTAPKQKPANYTGFSPEFTDHMFVMNYTEGTGWHDARIVPYGSMEFMPSTSVLHYGQTTFEGMKAYKNEDGSCYLFRPEMNARRVNISNARMSMPTLPEEDFLQAVKTLVEIDKEWVPSEKDSSLYIRPFFIATDPYLGVAISKTYLFMIIMVPSGPYFGTLGAVNIWIEEEYVRSIRGGTGYAKTGGNYSGSMIAQARAQQNGYQQVMWLDGIEHKYVEEVGSMNIFFKIGGKIVTPALNGSILSGVTRDSILRLCRDFGLETEERPITVDELFAASEQGTLEEIFGTGTAVVVSPVGKLRYKDREILVGNGEPGEVSRRLYDTLTAIQRGNMEDRFGWRVEV